jgi:hypothetical protein
MIKDIDLYWRKYQGIILALGCALYLFVIRQRLTDTIMKSWDLPLLIIVAGYFSGLGWVEKMKNTSPHVIFPVMKTTLGTSPLLFNDGIKYYLFRMGGYTGEWTVKGNSGVAIVPVNATEYKGINWNVLTLPEQVPLSRLPTSAKNIIKDLNLRPPYYFCLRYDTINNHDTRKQKTDTLMSEYASLIQSYNASFEEMNNIIDNKFDHTSGLIALSSNQFQSFQPPVQKDIFGRPKKPSE